MSKISFKHPYWTDYSDYGSKYKTKDENFIIEICASILGKPNWQTKYKDEEISNKWRSEIRAGLVGKTKYIDKIIDFVFEELAWTDSVEREHCVSISFDNMVIYTDKLKLDDIKPKLQEQSVALTKEYGAELDYHPGSNNTVVDLVHPSLFPLQYDRTVVVTDGVPEVVQYTDKLSKVKSSVSFGISKRYQWLPSLFSLQNGTYKIDSYINNLDPLKHHSLYSSIEKFFNTVVPQVNYVLSRYASSWYTRVPPPVECTYGFEYGESSGSESGEDDYDARKQERDELRRKSIKLIVPTYSDPPMDNIINLKEQFPELKVIVKLANIELTPENPEYKGGSWHVEGAINEDIVLTILYYYDVENITESKISFRQAFESPDYEQDDSVYLEEVYDLKDEDPLIKHLGDITCQEDRVIVFPNYYHHRVNPFRLKDPNKPGHRKILCLFLVDPNNKFVATTKEVPPQQKSWWSKQDLIQHLLPDEELRKKVVELHELQTLDEAKAVREKLMAERVSELGELENSDYQFSLCEH